jgi:hypothetical protein
MTALKMSRTDKTPAEIIQNLYLGSIGTALSKEKMKEIGITHILTAADKLKPPFADVKISQLTKLRISFIKSIPFLTLLQKVLLNSSLKHVISWKKCLVIQKTSYLFIGNRNSFNFSFAGKSRSTTMICAYLMNKKDMNLLDALALCKEKRPIVQPNKGFLIQLICYEKKLFGKMSDAKTIAKLLMPIATAKAEEQTKDHAAEGPTESPEKKEETEWKGHGEEKTEGEKGVDGTS